MNLKQFILDRLQETATWRALIVLATLALGRTFTDLQLESLVTLAVVISSSLGLAMPDKVPGSVARQAEVAAKEDIKRDNP